MSGIDTMSSDTRVWVFNGSRPNFPFAVFSGRALAEEWIASNRLTGTLTAYPLDISVYEWASQRGYIKRPPGTEIFWGSAGAYLEHYHYENGA
jgi:hypothetical protein